MRTKKAIINFITDALPQIIILILGFFKVKLFLKFLGDDNLGLYQLYGQIVTYLTLVEGGVGSAMLFKLFRPIHKHNQKKINEIMSASRTIFNVVGLIIIVLGIIISFNVRFLIKANSFENSYLIITFMLFLLSQSLNYFTLPYRIMFDASQDRYIPNLIYQTITIIKSVVEIILVCTGNGLVSILISLVICSVIANLLIYISFKIKYPKISFKGKKDFSMIKDVKHLFVNTIGNLVANNIDILLISKFIGLGTVVIYTTYNYFVEAVKQLIDKLTGATLSGIGDLLVSENSNKEAIFDEYNNLVFFLATLICTPFFIFINGFINVWYEGRISTSIIYSLLFAVLLFLNIVRIPLKVFSISSGKFKEIKRYVILEIIINFGLSLLLITKFGISGVLLATIVSIVVADFIFKVRIIYKKIIRTSSFNYYKYLIINTLFTIVMNTIFYSIIPKDYGNVIICIAVAIVVAFINLIFTIIYFSKTKQLSFMYRFKIYNKIISKKRGSEA